MQKKTNKQTKPQQKMSTGGKKLACAKVRVGSKQGAPGSNSGPSSGNKPGSRAQASAGKAPKKTNKATAKASKSKASAGKTKALAKQAKASANKPAAASARKAGAAGKQKSAAAAKLHKTHRPKIAKHKAAGKPPTAPGIAAAEPDPAQQAAAFTACEAGHVTELDFETEALLTAAAAAVWPADASSLDSIRSLSARVMLEIATSLGMVVPSMRGLDVKSLCVPLQTLERAVQTRWQAEHGPGRVPRYRELWPVLYTEPCFEEQHSGVDGAPSVVFNFGKLLHQAWPDRQTTTQASKHDDASDVPIAPGSGKQQDDAAAEPQPTQLTAPVAAPDAAQQAAAFAACEAGHVTALLPNTEREFTAAAAAVWPADASSLHSIRSLAARVMLEIATSLGMVMDSSRGVEVEGLCVPLQTLERAVQTRWQAEYGPGSVPRYRELWPVLYTEPCFEEQHSGVDGAPSVVFNLGKLLHQAWPDRQTTMPVSEATRKVSKPATKVSKPATKASKQKVPASKVRAAIKKAVANKAKASAKKAKASKAVSRNKQASRAAAGTKAAAAAKLSKTIQPKISKRPSAAVKAAKLVTERARRKAANRAQQAAGFPSKASALANRLQKAASGVLDLNMELQKYTCDCAACRACIAAGAASRNRARRVGFGCDNLGCENRTGGAADALDSDEDMQDDGLQSPDLGSLQPPTGDALQLADVDTAVPVMLDPAEGLLAWLNKLPPLSPDNSGYSGGTTCFGGCCDNTSVCKQQEQGDVTVLTDGSLGAGAAALPTHAVKQSSSAAGAGTTAGKAGPAKGGSGRAALWYQKRRCKRMMRG